MTQEFNKQVEQFDNMLNLMKSIENNTVDHSVYNSTSVGTKDVAAMQHALNALFEAEKMAASVEKDNNDLDVDLDKEMSYGDDISINKISEGKFSLSIGTVVLVKESPSEQILSKIKNMIEEGKSFDDIEVHQIVNKINTYNQANRLIKESKQKYSEFKSKNNEGGMEQQKKIYNTAKKKLQESIQYLSE